jgi:hypothetical protein
VSRKDRERPVVKLADGCGRSAEDGGFIEVAYARREQR